MLGERRKFGIDAFWLKILACLTMLVDHSFCLIPDLSTFGTQILYNILRTVGRLAFPIFAFQVSEGFRHTSNPRKYALKLFAFGIISQPVFMAYFGTQSPNTLFTLLLGLTAGYALSSDRLVLHPNNGENERFARKSVSSRILNVLFAVGTVWLAECFDTDYGAWGAMLVLVFIVLRDRKRLMLAFAGIMVLLYDPNVLLSIMGTAVSAAAALFGRSEPNLGELLNAFFDAARIAAKLAALCLIAAYNGRQGRKTGIFPYIFYPAHLLLLYFIKLLAI